MNLLPDIDRKRKKKTKTNTNSELNSFENLKLTEISQLTSVCLRKRTESSISFSVKMNGEMKELQMSYFSFLFFFFFIFSGNVFSLRSIILPIFSSSNIVGKAYLDKSLDWPSMRSIVVHNSSNRYRSESSNLNI